VDPKYDMSPFENIPIDIIMPNTKEFERIKSNIQDYKIGLIANKKGMDGAVLKRNGKDTNIEPLKGKVPENREMDVGCGAVFGAYFVSSILHGNTYEQSILLANYAAGLKVSKEFGHIVSPKDVLKDVISEENYFLSNKTVFQNILLEKSLSSHNKSSLQ
jgi:D-beta-D-heptose 7-phosphate kinase/D-beta-D-heptose 1-phosphate adenosyltransferase